MEACNEINTNSSVRLTLQVFTMPPIAQFKIVPNLKKNP